MSRSSSFTLRWVTQAALGVLLVILLGVHLVVNHWVARQGLFTYADIVSYYDVPGIVWMEAAFLTIVTSHCLLGLHSILLDLNLKPSTTWIITRLLVVLGVVTMVYGWWLIRLIALQSIQ